MSCLHPLSGVPIHLYTLRVCVCLHLLLIQYMATVHLLGLCGEDGVKRLFIDHH